MRPHAQHAHGSGLLVDLVYQPMLDVDAPGIQPFEVPGELLIGRRRLKGVVFQQFGEGLCLSGKAGAPEQFQILDGLSVEQHLPLYSHCISSMGVKSLSGAALASWMLSTRPGMEYRRSVS